MKIRPVKKIQGTLSLPGDKSISHRAAILAALAEGTTRIENFAPGADCASTLSCLRQLGVEIERDGNTVVVHGVGMNGLKAPTAELDCGNSGTTMRLLAGVLAGQNFTSVLVGDHSLSGRPMQRIIEPLTQMGAVIESLEGHAPLKIKGKFPLNAISYSLPKPSAQVKSCILLAGLFAERVTEVIEATGTRDHTERMLPHFSFTRWIAVSEEGWHIKVCGGKKPEASNLTIPGDISSAAFFMVAAACLPGSELALRDLGVNRTRRAILDILEKFGVDRISSHERDFGPEPVSDIVISGIGFQTPTTPAFIVGKETAALIDEIPVLAVLGTQLPGGLEIRDASELRLKESDRIRSMAENLRLMGARVVEFADGFHVDQAQLKGAKVDSFGDHRIAMAMAVAGLLAEGETEITGAECVDISFPGFFAVLEELSG
jgi:3-phosphoshikimate 1-carboxyvinyltransferase